MGTVYADPTLRRRSAWAGVAPFTSSLTTMQLLHVRATMKALALHGGGRCGGVARVRQLSFYELDYRFVADSLIAILPEPVAGTVDVLTF